MALIIESLSTKYGVASDAYAKISNVLVDNTSGIATFSTSIYKSKSDKTVIGSIRRISFNFIDEKDIVAQCYDALKSELAATEAKKSDMQAAISADTEKKDREAIWALSVLNADSIFKIKGATDDI
jgi:hypothetical protein